MFDKMLFILKISHSFTLTILVSHKSCSGKSSVSESKTGIEPHAKASQNLIELGPEPLGQRVKLLLTNKLLYRISI